MSLSDKPRPLVSVVVCNFNYDRYLTEAINSVLTQSYANIQIVIVDDGSNDSSREILSSLCDARIATVLQDNAGQAAAFNAGFARCNGDFVAFLDSDDFWYKTKLETAISAFDDPKIGLVQHNLDVVDESSIRAGKVHPGLPARRLSIEDSYFSENHTGFFCPTSGIVCRKAALDRIFPIDVGWKICADVAFTRPMPIFGEILTLNEVLGAYRIHGNNRWMNSDAQAKWVNNQQLYVDYTNDWLTRCGYRQQLRFEESKQFAMYSKMQLSGTKRFGIGGSVLKKLMRLFQLEKPS